MIKIVDKNAFYLRVTGKTRIGEYETTLDMNVIDSLIVNFVRRGRVSQTYTIDANNRVQVYNSGILAKGVYGVEFVGYYNGQPWRHFASEIFAIVDDNGTEPDATISNIDVFDVTIYMKLSGDGVTAEFVQAMMEEHNADALAHTEIRSEIPAKTSDLNNDAGFQTEQQVSNTVQTAVMASRINDAEASLVEDGGQPDLIAGLSGQKLILVGKNLKGEKGDDGEKGDTGETGPAGPQGATGVYDSSQQYPPFEFDTKTGGSSVMGMTQEAITKEVTIDEVIEKFYGASLTQGKGYVTPEGGFTVSSSYVGAFIPISEYVGKKVKLFLGNGTLIRYAFTLLAPTTRKTTSILCQDCELVSVQNEEYAEDVVPSDAQYLYVYCTSSGTVMYPSKIEVYDNNKIKNAISEIEEKVGKSLDMPELQLEGEGVQNALTVANGMVAADGKYSLNANYFGAWLNVSKYRGKKILLKAAQTGDFYGLRYAFTLSAPTSAKTTSILCQGTSLVSYYWAHSQEVIEDVIPQDCNYLYVMIHDTNNGYYYPAELAIISPISNQVEANTEAVKELEERENVKAVRLFGYYFPGNESIEDLNGINAATIAADGMTLPVLTPITLPKLTVFDDEEFTLEVNATTSAKILFYAGQTKTGELSSTLQTSSHILFDFTNGRISIYQADTINTETGEGTEIDGIGFTSGSGTYILTIGRKQRQVFASIYNKTTRAKVEVTCVESVHSGVNVAQRPAGWMYKYPSFMTLAGTPKYIRFNGYTDGGLYMLFQGDSYTEGYAGFYPDAWTRNACKYFRNSRTCGLSGHKLDDIVQQYHESIKGKVKTEVIVISIGINDMSDLTSDALITAWGERFRTYIEELVEDGITPIVNRIWPEGSATSSTATKAAKMNNIIRSFGYDGADFGAVEGYSTSSYYTQGHLSVSGNQLSYDIFVNELSQYKK